MRLIAKAITISRAKFHCDIVCVCVCVRNTDVAARSVPYTATQKHTTASTTTRPRVDRFLRRTTRKSSLKSFLKSKLNSAPTESRGRVNAATAHVTIKAMISILQK